MPISAAPGMPRGRSGPTARARPGATNRGSAAPTARAGRVAAGAHDRAAIRFGPRPRLALEPAGVERVHARLLAVGGDLVHQAVDAGLRLLRLQGSELARCRVVHELVVDEAARLD